jgi:hypothetical protein
MLREQDSVLSAIRIVDKWTVRGPSPTIPPTVIQASLTILFKGGIYRGQAQVTVTPITPSNNRLQPIILPLLFEDPDDKGAGVILPMAFPIQEDGPYWFEVALSRHGLPSDVVTYVPMRIVYLQIAGPMLAPPSPDNPDL